MINLVLMRTYKDRLCYRVFDSISRFDSLPRDLSPPAEFYPPGFVGLSAGTWPGSGILLQIGEKAALFQVGMVFEGLQQVLPRQGRFALEQADHRAPGHRAEMAGFEFQGLGHVP